MLAFTLALLYANAFEWFTHKYVLHGLGRRPGSFFRFHWVDHHRTARLHRMHDDGYARMALGDTPQVREFLSLALGLVVHLPIAWWSPSFFAGLSLAALGYYFVHRRSHLDPEWAARWVPWHVDHHMASNQDLNWCVTFPLFDWILGTRRRWLGTETSTWHGRHPKPALEKA